MLWAALVLTYPTAVVADQPPFEEWLGVDGVALSNDRYGIWFSINATRFRTRLPGHSRTVTEKDPGQFLSLLLACRADGSPTGGPGTPLLSVLLAPLHPEHKDVPLMWSNPFMYFWRGLSGREFVHTPVQVRLGKEQIINSQLLRQTINYNVSRPDQKIELQADVVLRAVAAADPAMRVVVAGEDTLINAIFRLGPGNSRIFESMTDHCRA